MFMSDVMGEYAKVLQYPNYEKHLWDGVRLVQDIAFTPPLRPSEKAIKKKENMASYGEVEIRGTAPRTVYRWEPMNAAADQPVRREMRAPPPVFTLAEVAVV